MKVSQIKALDQVTIIYSKKDVPKVKEYLEQLKNDYYCFNYEPNKIYQFRKRKNPKVPRRKNNEKNKYTGVFRRKGSKKYTAQIKNGDKSVYLGQRDTEEEAHQLRLDYIKDNDLVNRQ